jgi:Transglycosylase SLT domain
MNTLQRARAATLPQGTVSSNLINCLKNVVLKAAIGLIIASIAGLGETHAAELTALQGDDSTASEQTVPIDAFGFLGGIFEAHFYEPHATANRPRDEIRQAAALYGVDLPMMLTIAKVESDFDPYARTGSYKGLFQLGEIAFKQYGEGNIWDARDNARAAAHMLLVQAQMFHEALGHYPDYAERYMIHQQGIEGAIEHYRHPERPAWQAMCATSEGTLKGERWCKMCIWGNLLPGWKRELGSVDKILSGDFVSHWTSRINLLANKYLAERDVDFADRAPIDRAPTIEKHSSLRRLARRKPSRLFGVSRAVAHPSVRRESSEPAPKDFIGPRHMADGTGTTVTAKALRASDAQTSYERTR